ncbi:MAG: RNA methyltransferase [Polyangiaceae bacterium]
MLVPISSLDDPRVSGFAEVRERDLVRRQGRFIAEGKVVLDVLTARAPERVLAVLLSERRLASAAPLVARLPSETPVYVVSQDLMDGLVGFSIHRGILALAERGPDRDARELVAGARVVVGLIGLSNHDNVGGVFRSAAAFGADAVLFDEATCDPLYRKSIRVSVGGALLVPFARCGSAHAMLDLFEEAGFEVIGLSPHGELEIDALHETGRRALLVGAEGPGLAPDVLARVRRVRIGMAPGFDSLNVAVACGIALHAVTRASRPRLA